MKKQLEDLTGVNATALVAASVAAYTTYSMVKSMLRPRPMGNVFYPKPCKLIRGFLMGSLGDVYLEPPGKMVFEWAAYCDKLETKLQPCVQGMGTNVLLIYHPEDLEYILVDKPENFPKDPVYNKLKPLLGEGLVTILDESFHTTQRKLCSPAFGPLQLKKIADEIMTPNLLELVKKMRHLADTTDGQKTNQVEVVCQKQLLSVILEAALRVKDNDNVVEKMGSILRGGFTTMVYLLPWALFSFPRKTQSYITFTETRKLTHAAVREAVTTVIEETGGDFTNIEDKEKSLIDRVIAGAKDLKDPREIDRIDDHGVTFVFAGQDTLSGALSWTFYSLAKTQHTVQTKLYEELCDIMASNSSVSIEDLSPAKMPYLNAVIHESLRVHPPVHDVARVAAEDEYLPSGIVVPKGTSIYPYFAQAHRYKPLWGDDADEFKPERWMSDDGQSFNFEFLDKVTPCGFLPFSAGKRNCIGKEFAMDELRLAVALLIRNIEFEWPDDEPEPVLVHVIVTKPETPISLKIKARSE